MTVVKELNELAKKMTGVNPKAKTDQQALNYIEQNYSGGDTPTPQSKFDYIIPIGIDFSELSSGDEITNTNVIEVLNDIKDFMSSELKPIIVGLHYYDIDGNYGFSISSSFQYYNTLERIYFYTNDYKISLNYSNNKWLLTTYD